MDEVKSVNREEIKRPFVIQLEAGIAKKFIKACQQNGIFVRETVRDLLNKFADENLKEEKQE